MSAPARSESLDPEVAAWLCAPTGVAAVADVTAWLDEGDDDLTVASRLRVATRRREGLPAARAVAVQAAAHARRRARADWPDADQLLFTPAALEQASHPAASAWRARRFADVGAVVDLCAGAGGDSLALATAGEVVAVDRDLGRLHLCRHNATVRGAPVRVVVGDALRPPLRLTGAVHCDPSRRVAGRRLRRLGEYRPPVDAVLGATTNAVGSGIVCSPALDLADPVLPADAELEFVQLGGDLLEAMLWTGALARRPGTSTATLLPSAEQWRSTPGTTDDLPVGPVGDWLVSVAPAAVRARCHDEIGATIAARRVAHRRALLTCDTPPPPSAWYVARRVEAVLPARGKHVRRWLQAADDLPVEIAVHGLDVAPDAFWSSLGRPPRGPNGRRLELVRTDEGGRCVVTRTTDH